MGSSPLASVSLISKGLVPALQSDFSFQQLELLLPNSLLIHFISYFRSQIYLGISLCGEKSPDFSDSKESNENVDVVKCFSFMEYNVVDELMTPISPECTRRLYRGNAL